MYGDGAWSVKNLTRKVKDYDPESDEGKNALAQLNMQKGRIAALNSQLVELGGREEIVQFLDFEEAGDGAYRHGRTPLLALVGIACDMRRGYVHHAHKRLVYIGFVIPGIDDDRSQFGDCVHEGVVHNHLAASRIDEECNQLHL
jgi:hypothetical protein